MDYKHFRHLPHFEELGTHFEEVELAHVVSRHTGKRVHRWCSVIGLHARPTRYNLLYFTQVAQKDDDEGEFSSNRPETLSLDKIVQYDRLEIVESFRHEPNDTPSHDELEKDYRRVMTILATPLNGQHEEDIGMVRRLTGGSRYFAAARQNNGKVEWDIYVGNMSAARFDFPVKGIRAAVNDFVENMDGYAVKQIPLVGSETDWLK